MCFVLSGVSFPNFFSGFEILIGRIYIGIMDQAISKGSGEILNHVDERVDEDLNQLVEGKAIDAGAGHSLGEGVSVSGEDGKWSHVFHDEEKEIIHVEVQITELFIIMTLYMYIYP